jgi:hypothetical protein
MMINGSRFSSMCARSGLCAALLFGCAAGADDETRDKSSPVSMAWSDVIEVASGGGYRGPWRMNESEYDYVDDPSVAVAANGSIGVVWVDQARKDVLFQMYGSNGRPRLEAPVNVSRSPRIFSWLPRMVIAGDDADEVFILWQEIVFSGGSHGGEMFFARSTDGGKSFSTPINLSNTTAGAGKGRLDPRSWHNGSLDLAMGPNGDLHAAWTEYEGRLWFSRSTDRGESFSQPLLVAGSGDDKPARGPSLAVTPSGTVLIAWTVGEDVAADIHFAKSDDGGGSFIEPKVFFASEGHADAPKIAVDRAGTLHVVYAESPGGPQGRYHIRYTRWASGMGGFEEPRQISPADLESAGFPALSVGRNGEVYVLWEQYPRRGARSRGLGITYSNDAGSTFAAPSIIPGSDDPTHGVNGSQQGLLMRKLAINDAGGVAIVNSTFLPNQSSRIWLFQGRIEGP